MTALTAATGATHGVQVCCESCGRPVAVEFEDYGNVEPFGFWTVMLGVHASSCGFCHEGGNSRGRPLRADAVSSGRGEGAPAVPSPQAAAFLRETFKHADDGVLLAWSKAGSLWWDPDELDDAAAAFTARGAERDVWVGCGLRATPSANGGRGTDRDVVGIPGLWSDIDEPLAEVAPALNAFECPPSLLVCSGHHTHAWWLLDEFWTFSSDDERVEARTLLRRLHAFLRTQGWKVDAVHDLARVMRVPGTLNHKGAEPVPVTLRDNGQPRRYPFTELDEWLPPGEPAPLPGDRPPPPESDVAPEEVNRLAASWAAGDERFARTWARQRDDFGSASEYDLAVCVKGADMGADDATSWALVRRWRQLHGEDTAKADRDDYATGTLAKARAGAPPQVVAPAELDDDDVDTATLLDDTYKFKRRFVVCSDAGLVAGTLWIAHAHAFDAAEYSPRLSVRSPEAGSGKTRHLETDKLLVPRPLLTVETSVAALFRMVRLHKPTLLFDETDALVGPRAKDREDLRALLNAGFERGAEVPRCVGDGASMKVEMYPVFAPVALAGLGKLPHTLETRSIVVRMRPRTADEHVERLNKRRVKPDADRLRSRWAAWAERHTEQLRDAEPALPGELSDRAQDIWEPLLAIADLAGGDGDDDWPARARAAAVELHAAGEDDELSIGRQLLWDARTVFDDPERDDPHDDEKGQAITSGALAAALAAIEGAPWAEWSRDGKPITATRVARMLRPFEIRPGQHWVASAKLRGYLRSDFEDAWERHLSEPEPPAPEPEPPLRQKVVEPVEVVGARPSKGKGSTTSPALPVQREGTSALDGEDGA